jgi:hypothetical protein
MLFPGRILRAENGRFMVCPELVVSGYMGRRGRVV